MPTETNLNSLKIHKVPNFEVWEQNYNQDDGIGPNDLIIIPPSELKKGMLPSSWYGTCGTAAGTSAKVVTCSDYILQTGTIIGVLFTTANTTATPTLNVNSTGAKSIYIGASTPDSTTNVLKWSANTMIYFMYDGTYYRYITSISAGSVVSSRGANTWYGTSSTSASTQAKTSTIDNFVLTKGSVVYITFSTANTYTSAKITLNINSTGAKDVYYNNAVTSSTNTLPWDAGETLTFIYSGSYYYFVGKTKSSVTSVNNKTGAVTLTASDVGALSSSTVIPTVPTMDASPTDGNNNNTVSSNGVYDMVMGRTKIYTGSCSTAAATAAKVVTLDDATGFSLATGVKVAVTFSNANTTTGTTTLNVNSTGAKNVVFYGDDEAGGYYTADAIYNKWGARETLIFTYTGSSWCHTPSQYFTDLTYKLASSKQSKITASGLLKGDGNGGVTAAVVDVDYIDPADLGFAGGVATLDGDGKITPDQLSSKIETVTSSRDLATSDNCRTLLCANSNVTLTIPDTITTSHFECEIIRWQNTNTVTITAGSNVKIAFSGGTTTYTSFNITDACESAILKRIMESSGNQYWLIQGKVEAIS